MPTEETHPFKLFTPPGCTILIVGTFPPTKRNWSYDFFYPNKQNLFWKIMSQIAGKALQYSSGKDAVEERKEILTALHVAITDMGLKITRSGESSLDENLTAIEYMDIFEILDQHELIHKIIFTSSSGKVSAAQWFLNYLKQKNSIHKFPKGLKPIKSKFEYKTRTIKLAILYSPSRRAANRISLDKLTGNVQAGNPGWINNKGFYTTRWVGTITQQLRHYTASDQVRQATFSQIIFLP